MAGGSTILTPLGGGMGNSSGGRMAPMLAPFGAAGHLSTQNLMVMSTGGGMHNNPLQSNFIVEVDEFKFSKIVSSVLQKGGGAAAHHDEEVLVAADRATPFDDSCSLSDYGEETVADQEEEVMEDFLSGKVNAAGNG